MAKKKIHRHKPSLMGRSDIPYAQRIAMQRRNEIKANRDHSAKITMFCMSVAMNKLEGIGYKRLVRFSLHFKECVDEFYDDPEVKMVHACRRLEQLGISFSGFCTVGRVGDAERAKELFAHSLQASQIAMACGIVAANDEFGFGKERLTRIFDMVEQLSEQYAEEGEKFLLDEMARIGFKIVDGIVCAYTDDDGNAVTPLQAERMGIE